MTQHKATKLLINGEAGTGKSTLLKDLKDAFVISRDGKDFPFRIPHTTFRYFDGMTKMIEGYDEVQEVTDAKGKTSMQTVHVDGIIDKLEKYKEKNGKYPTTIVIDSVSKLTNDIIEKGSTDFKNFDIHNYVKSDLGLLNKFIHEYLELKCDNMILINHIYKKEDEYVTTGQGNFKDKGGFYSEVSNSITLINKSEKSREVITRGKRYQARTTLANVPDRIPVAYINHETDIAEVDENSFNLQTFLDRLNEHKTESSEFEY